MNGSVSGLPETEIAARAEVDWDAVPEGLLWRVARFSRHEGLVHAGQRLLVACSGGGDSLALLALLHHPGFAHAAGLDARLDVVVGHVDHGLREASPVEAAAVARLAERLSCECVAETLRWPKGAGEGVSPPNPSEAALRDARLDALGRMAAEVSATAVALGHTASDQLETLLMRLVRGSGLSGMAGMAPRRGLFVRPLLTLTREEVGTVVSAVGWRPIQDPSNLTDGYLRNRLRHHVVPLLVAENPRVEQAAFRTAAALRQELEALEHTDRVVWDRVGGHTALGPSVDVDTVRSLPPGLSSRLLRRMWRWARTDIQASRSVKQAEIGREHLQEVRALLVSDAGTRTASLPGGVVAMRSYGRLILCPERALVDPGDLEWDIPGPGVYPLEGLEGWLEVSEASVTLENRHETVGDEDMRAGATDPGVRERADRGGVWLHGLGEPGAWDLRVRNHRPGDRVRLSAGG